jgi:DNA polymerase III gamma/tau subunit
MALYHKHRPTSFDEVTGNEKNVELLRKSVAGADCPHAFLLHGPTGCGKTTLGRIVAKELGCVGSDFREVDSADFRGIDTIRDMRKQARYQPLEGPCRVWLLDECHKMSNDAQSALLKALEDPQPHVYYILATTDPQKLLNTIRGRCSQFAVSLLDEKQMMTLLRKVVKAEEDTLPKSVYEQIVQDAAGHPRNALQILDQVLRVDEDQRLEVAKQAAETVVDAIELCRALIDNAGWKKTASILTKLKEQEPESVRRLVLGYCTTVLLKSGNPQAARIIESFRAPLYDIGYPGLVFASFDATFDGE